MNDNNEFAKHFKLVTSKGITIYPIVDSFNTYRVAINIKGVVKLSKETYLINKKTVIKKGTNKIENDLEVYKEIQNQYKKIYNQLSHDSKKQNQVKNSSLSA
ncbi:MAG: hypothetical protein ACK4JX_04465 [Flavobacterium sp.]